MAKKRIIGYADEESFRRVREATRRVRSTPRVGAQRRRQVPVVGESCPKRNEIHRFHVLGSPTGGTFTLTVVIPTEAGNVSEAIQIDYNATAGEVMQAFEGHSAIEEGDVLGAGGTLPNQTVSIEFLGDRLGGVRIPPPHADWSNLTGGSGVAVVPITLQDGFPRSVARETEE